MKIIKKSCLQIIQKLKTTKALISFSKYKSDVLQIWPCNGFGFEFLENTYLSIYILDLYLSISVQNKIQTIHSIFILFQHPLHFSIFHIIFHNITNHYVNIQSNLKFSSQATALFPIFYTTEDKNKIKGDGYGNKMRSAVLPSLFVKKSLYEKNQT